MRRTSPRLATTSPSRCDASCTRESPRSDKNVDVFPTRTGRSQRAWQLLRCVAESLPTAFGPRRPATMCAVSLGEDPPKPIGDGALSELKRVVDLLLRLRSSEANDVVAQIVAEDPDWDTREKTRRHVAMLWGDLQRAVTAEVGSALARQVTDWTIDDFTSRIVIGEPDDFDADCPDDEPYGWLPLAVAHCREAGWDFSPKEDSGTWIGWFEPEVAWAIEGTNAHVRGVLSAFIVVRDGTLEFAHVVRRRRRAGIATRLVEFAVRNHGLTAVSGILSNDGQALVSALRRDGLLP